MLLSHVSCRSICVALLRAAPCSSEPYSPEREGGKKCDAKNSFTHTHTRIYREMQSNTVLFWYVRPLPRVPPYPQLFSALVGWLSYLMAYGCIWSKSKLIIWGLVNSGDISGVSWSSPQISGDLIPDAPRRPSAWVGCRTGSNVEGEKSRATNKIQP